MKKIVNKKYLINFFILILFINIIIALLPNLGEDEAFTMSLIKHSYSQIITIDELDVHPPLYYLLLKTFLIISTFWTKSIIIKIIFSRIFSLLNFVLLFFILVKALKLLNIKRNYVELFSFYLIFPSISYFSIYIRMYQFCAMLIALEIYGLLLCKINRNNYGIFLVIMAVTIGLYTNYFTAMFMGLLLLIEFLRYLFTNKKLQSIKILFIGIISIILYLPCLRITYYQLSYVASNKYSNQFNVSKFATLCQSLYMLIGHNGSGIISISLDILLLLIQIGIFISICKYSKNTLFKNLVINVYIAFIFGIILMNLYFLFSSHSVAQARYSFPMFATIYFLLVTYIEKNINSKKMLENIFIIFIGLVLLFVNIKETSIGSLKTYIDTDSPIITRVAKNISSTRQHYLYLNNKNNASGTITATFYSTYLYKTSHHKILVNALTPKYTLGSNNDKLMREVYNNILIKKK